MKKNYCIDCEKAGIKKEITRRAKRCGSCANKGLNNPGFGSDKLIGRIHTNPNCQCTFCKGKRGELEGSNNPNFNNKWTLEMKKKASLIKGGTGIPYEHAQYNQDIFSPELKEQIRIRDNFECQNCGMTEEEHLIVYGRMLNIHHIDYNKENYEKTNLITTCLPCNVRANYNRDYWKEYYNNKIKDNINGRT